MKQKYSSMFLIFSLLFSLLAPSVSLAIGGSLNDFHDIEGHWAESEIKELIKEEIVKGSIINGELLIKPESEITRAEFYTILIRSHELNNTNEDSSYITSFKDIGDHWAKPYIEVAEKNELTEGYEDGTFKPDQKITRAEAVTALVRAYKMEKEDQIETSVEMNDLSSSHWAYSHILLAVNEGLVEGYPDGTFRAENNIKRAESFVIIHRMINKEDEEKEEEKEEEEEENKSPTNPSNPGGSGGSGGSDESDVLTISGDWSFDTETDILGWEISWTRLGDSKTYNVYRSYTNDEESYELIESNNEGSSYIDDEFNPSGVTYYIVAPVKNGDEEQKSNKIIADANLDSDNDGLTDALEAFYGTDPNNPDTDGDGLPDEYEIYILGTDPLVIDSNGNGIEDGDDDNDNDGLTNREEFELGTDPLLADSDFDGLTDFEEVRTYNTEPLYQDTDGDGMLDGDEVQYGTDPLDPDSNGNGILDGDETYEVLTEVRESERDPNVTPSITMDTEGKNIDSVSISKIGDGNTFLNSDIPGYLGAAYNFKTDVEFDEATMVFAYDDSVVTDDFRPEIFYYNLEEQRLDRVDDQKIDKENNTVTVELDHFSTYLLLNGTEWDEVWEHEIRPPLVDDDGGMLNIDIVFSIDSSGSMAWEDPNDLRKTASKAFVDRLKDEDRAAVVDFDSRAELLVELTTDKNEIKYAIDMIDSSGGTNLQRGVTEAIDEIVRNGEEDHLKYVIFLTDGNGSWNDSAIDYANEHDVAVYTIGLGEGVDESLLEKIANETGGKYFFASDADKLEGIFDETAGDTIDFTKDTDGDGIPDYLEKQGIRIGNGEYIYTEYENEDTDSDGLLDGEEVEIHVSKNTDDKVYFTLHSHPRKKDSDGDGIEDLLDPEPMEYNITDRSLSLAAALSYTNLNANIYSDIGRLANNEFSFKNLDSSDIEELSNWSIIQANDSGIGYWGDFWDSGLGSVAVKITRADKTDMIIYALRGTEIEDDALNDFATDARLALSRDSFQSRNAFNEYKTLINDYPNADFYLAGHSLGGRLVQDVLYKTHNANDGKFGFFKDDLKTPNHSASFNALGYDNLIYKTLKNSIVDDIKPNLYNYYYEKDVVGHLFGDSAGSMFGLPTGYKRLGTNIGPWTAKDKNGEVIPVSGSYSLKEIHGISLFTHDKNLLYPNINILD